MNKRTCRILIPSLICFISIAFYAQLRIASFRDEISQELTVSAVPIPTELLRAMAGEFKGVVANYLLLEAASFIGGNTNLEAWEWDAVARLLEQSSVLEPHFKQTYTFAQGTLPWYTNKVEITMNILDRGKDHRVWDWIPNFFIGFNHFYFNQDYQAASKALMDASQVPDAPSSLATWGARLASQAGQFKIALEFLEGMYATTEGEQQREMIKERIVAVQGAYVLQQAVDRFRDQYGSYPISLDELIDRDILSEIPFNPYLRPYALNDGIVEF